MTLDQYKDFLATVTYKGKPCVKLLEYDPRRKFRPCPAGYIYLSVWVESPDSHDMDKTTQIEIGMLESIADIERSTPFSQLTYIKNIIVQLEMHEIQELLMVDGKRVFDPHDQSRIRVIRDKDLSDVQDHIEIEEEAA